MTGPLWFWLAVAVAATLILVLGIDWLDRWHAQRHTRRQRRRIRLIEGPPGAPGGFTWRGTTRQHSHVKVIAAPRSAPTGGVASGEGGHARPSSPRTPEGAA